MPACVHSGINCKRESFYSPFFRAYMHFSLLQNIFPLRPCKAVAVALVVMQITRGAEDAQTDVEELCMLMNEWVN